MLFRPKFCANCGEKIDRVEWGVLTSRRFCDVCAVEYKGYEMIPRTVVAAGLISGLFGFGSYLSSDPHPVPRTVQSSNTVVERPLVTQVKVADAVEANNSTVPARPEGRPSQSETSALQRVAQPAKIKPNVAETVYLCGAETKKGTPCSRRVKTSTRCYQHAGMPAMVSAERNGGN
jgi:hypothetical protein